MDGDKSGKGDCVHIFMLFRNVNHVNNGLFKKIKIVTRTQILF
jgi:hypothetical protein